MTLDNSSTKSLNDKNEKTLPDNSPIYKVVVVGDGQVGKTNLIRRYCENRFESKGVQAIGSFLRKEKVPVQDEVGNSSLVTLHLYESSDYRKISPDALYGDALGVVMVYDVTSPVSFFSLYRWKQEIQRTLAGMPLVVVGNKNDLPSIVPMSEAQGWATFEGIRFMNASAATGEGVNAVFEQVARFAHDFREVMETQRSFFR
jgi:small GTP-binding protein